MLMIKAIVQPEKADEVMAELMLAGFPSISRWISSDVANRRA